MSKGQVAQLFCRLLRAFQELFLYFVIWCCKTFLHCILKQFVHSTISIKLNKKSLKAETPEAWWPDGVNFLASTKGERNSTVVLKDC